MRQLSLPVSTMSQWWVILDRLIHNAHRLPLDGPSLRKTADGGIGRENRN